MLPAEKGHNVTVQRLTDPISLARLHIYYCVQFWAPQYQKYLNQLGGNRRSGEKYISTPWIKEDEVYPFPQDTQIFCNWNCIISIFFEFSGQNRFKGMVITYVTPVSMSSSELPLFIQYVVPVACSSLLPVYPVPSIIPYLIGSTFW